MSLISTLDLSFRRKQYKYYIDEFGVNNVILIKKSKLFLRLKVLFPIFFWLVLLGLIIYAIYIAIGELNVSFYWITGILSFLYLLGILFFLPNIRLVKRILDYKIDFIIVTPTSLIRYDQSGIFSRSSKIIELRNLKTASVRKVGVLNSLFNNGDLLFLSEGGFGMETDEARKDSLGEIVFRYVYNPESYRKEINRILDFSVKKGPLPEKTND